MRKTTLEANSKSVSIECGIYQGNALSPLLFCMGLNPTAKLLQRVAMDTDSKMEQSSLTSSMDDVKVYAKNKWKIDSLIHLTWI